MVSYLLIPPSHLCDTDLPGNQISVHGRIPNSPGGASQATFVVDGGKTGTFSSPNQKFVTYNKEFYNSGALPLGNHTLVVNPQTELEFWVDYFLVHDEVAIPTPSATPTPKSGGKIQITVITAVGIGVGCVVIGIAIAVFLFCLKRRRSQRRPYQHPPRSNPSKVDSSTLLPCQFFIFPLAECILTPFLYFPVYRDKLTTSISPVTWSFYYGVFYQEFDSSSCCIIPRLLHLRSFCHSF